MVAGALGAIPSGSKPAQIGRAVGEIVGGGVLMFLGAGGTFGGGVISASGIGAVLGIPAAAASVGLVTMGAASAAAGFAGEGAKQSGRTFGEQN